MRYEEILRHRPAQPAPDDHRPGDEAHFHRRRGRGLARGSHAHRAERSAGAELAVEPIEGLNGDLTPPYIGVNKRPILDYGRSDGAAVIGGYVYRGAEFAAELGGNTSSATTSRNSIWYHGRDHDAGDEGAALTTLPEGPGPNSGSDYRGTLVLRRRCRRRALLCQLSSTPGRIYKLQRGGTPSQPLPPTLSATGAFSNLATLTPSSEAHPVRAQSAVLDAIAR